MLFFCPIQAYFCLMQPTQNNSRLVYFGNLRQTTPESIPLFVSKM
jgi:hypothetical protein